MRRILSNIFWLGTKELRAFSRDVVLFALVIWAFSLSIVSIAQSNFLATRGLGQSKTIEISADLLTFFILFFANFSLISLFALISLISLIFR